MRTAARRYWRGRSLNGQVLFQKSLAIVSGGHDGEGVEVIGEGRPAGAVALIEAREQEVLRRGEGLWVLGLDQADLSAKVGDLTVEVDGLRETITSQCTNGPMGICSMSSRTLGPDTRIMIAPPRICGVRAVTGFRRQRAIFGPNRRFRLRAVSVASVDTLLTPP